MDIFAEVMKMGLYSTTTKSATNFYNVGYMTNDGNVIKVGLWPSKKNGVVCFIESPLKWWKMFFVSS